MTHRRLTLAIPFLGLLLTACGAAPPLEEVKEGVTLCAHGRCAPASKRSADDLLAALYNLYQQSRGGTYRLCESDPIERACLSEGLSGYVQGGPIPGVGTYSEGDIVDEAVADPTTRTVSATVDTSISFIGTPMVTVNHLSAARVLSTDRIIIAEDDYFSQWAVVGNGVMSFSMAVDYVDLDRGVLGGFYRWAWVGVGAGGASGYGLMRFPHAMAADENWLDHDWPVTAVAEPPPEPIAAAVPVESPPPEVVEEPEPPSAAPPAVPPVTPPAALGSLKEELAQLKEELAQQKTALAAERKRLAREATLREEMRRKEEAERARVRKMEAALQEELARQRAEMQRREQIRRQKEAARKAAAEKRQQEARLNLFGDYHALVIGNNAYKNLPQLKTAVRDAEAIAGVLRAQYGFNVTLLKNATRNDIVSALAELRKSLSSRDNLLIYYAGHGSLDREADEGFWLATNAERDNPINWISNANLTSMIRALNAKHVMVAADSCYAGKLTRGLHVKKKAPDFLQRMAQKKTRVALTSGGLEPVLDEGRGGHSVFANAFLDALRNNETVMDGTSLFQSVRHAVMLKADQTPEYADIRKAGHDGGDFLFVRRSSPPAKTPNGPGRRR